MNVNNIKGIKVRLPERTLVYEVVYMLRCNDLRDYSAYGDRRITKDLMGDGWKDQTDKREVLNENVDDFIKQLDRMEYDYTLLSEQDLKEAS